MNLHIRNPGGNGRILVRAFVVKNAAQRASLGDEVPPSSLVRSMSRRVNLLKALVQGSSEELPVPFLEDRPEVVLDANELGIDGLGRPEPPGEVSAANVVDALIRPSQVDPDQNEPPRREGGQ